MGKSWRRCNQDDLWLKVLSQIVVAGNAVPAYALLRSKAARRVLSFSRLAKQNARQRRNLIHAVLYAIGTRYVGKSPNCPKVDAALHNFGVLRRAGGPKRFFKNLDSIKATKAKIRCLSKDPEKLAYYGKKGCRDTLIELRLATDCMALDQRVRRIIDSLGATLPKSLNRHYDEIERELIDRVAKPCRRSGGELDRILFQNYGDIMVRLVCD